MRLTIIAVVWFAIAVLFSACAHDYQLMKMDEQVSAYGAAIRWNLFKKALGYQAEPTGKSPDWKTLQELKVTEYRVVSRDTFPSGKVLMQTAEIRYIPAGSVVEKALIDNQRWHFDEDSERWVIETGLPNFN